MASHDHALIVADLLGNRPAAGESYVIEVVKDENGKLKDVVLHETDTVKKVKEEVKKDEQGRIVEVTPHPFGVDHQIAAGPRLDDAAAALKGPPCRPAATTEVDEPPWGQT